MRAAPDVGIPSYDFDDSFPTGIIRAIPAYQVILKNRDRFYKTPFRPETFSGGIFSSTSFGKISTVHNL
jgi:hypothetical protein